MMQAACAGRSGRVEGAGRGRGLTRLGSRGLTLSGALVSLLAVIASPSLAQAAGKTEAAASAKKTTKPEEKAETSEKPAAEEKAKGEEDAPAASEEDASADADADVDAEEAGESSEKERLWTLGLRVPLVEYTRSRLTRDQGATWRKTTVDGILHSLPAVRVYRTLADWVLLGGEFGGGLQTVNIDGSDETNTSVMLDLELSARFIPLRYDWGYAHATLGLGGRFYSGFYIDESRSSTDITAIVPTGSGQLGVVFWLVPEIVGVEAGARAAYTFGPAQLPADGSGFMQELNISVDSGVTVSF